MIMSNHPTSGTAPRRTGALVTILALHALLLYCLQSSAISKPKVTLPATLAWITLPSQTAPAPEPAPEPKLLTPPKTLAAPSTAPQMSTPAPAIAATSTPATPATDTAISTTVETTPASAAPSAVASTSPATSAITPPAPLTPRTIQGELEYLQAPAPNYPSVAKRLGEHGKVLLRVLVDQSGRAERAEISQSSGFTRLDQAARAAVLRALFKPYLEDGKPVPVFAMIPIVFELG